MQQHTTEQDQNSNRAARGEFEVNLVGGDVVMEFMLISIEFDDVVKC